MNAHHQRAPSGAAGWSRAMGGLAIAALLLVGCQRKTPPKPPEPPTDDSDKSAAMKIDPRYTQPKPGSGSGSTKPVAPPVEAPKLPIRIAVFGPKTGEQDWLGNAYAQGANLRLTEFDKTPQAQRYSSYLSEEDSASGATGLAKLFNEHPGKTVAVIGHYDDDEAQDALRMYHRSQVLMFPLAPCAAQLHADGQVYAVGYETGYYARSILALARGQGMKILNVLAEGSPHASTLADALSSNGKASGVDVQGVVAITKPDEVAASIKKATAPEGLDGLVIAARDPRAVVAMLRGLVEAGFTRPVFVSDGGLSADFAREMVNVRPGFKVHVVGAFDPTSEAARAFGASYREAYAQEPDQWGALAYDVVGLFVASLSPEAEEINPATFEGYLRRSHATSETAYRGVTGDLYFDTKGRAVARSVYLLEFANGKYQRTAMLDHAARLRLETPDAPVGIPAPPESGSGSDTPVAAGSGSDTAPPIKAPPPVAAGTLVWHSKLDAALDQADEEDKPILVDFFSSTCGPCVQMAKTTWVSDAFKAVAGSWVLLRINLDEDVAFTSTYKIKDLPAIGFMTKHSCVVEIAQAAFLQGAEIAAEMERQRPRVLALTQRVAKAEEKAASPDNADKAEPNLELAKLFSDHRAYALAADTYQTAFHTLMRMGQSDKAISLFTPMLNARIQGVQLDLAHATADEWIAKYPTSKDVEYGHFIKVFAFLLENKFDEAEALVIEMEKKFGAKNKRVEKAKETFVKYAKRPLGGGGSGS